MKECGKKGALAWGSQASAETLLGLAAGSVLSDQKRNLVFPPPARMPVRMVVLGIRLQSERVSLFMGFPLVAGAGALGPAVGWGLWPSCREGVQGPCQLRITIKRGFLRGNGSGFECARISGMRGRSAGFRGGTQAGRTCMIQPLGCGETGRGEMEGSSRWPACCTS